MSTDRPDLLAQLPAHRREPVAAFVQEVVGTCPYCGKSVARDQSRGIDADERIGCFACVTAPVGKCSSCGQQVTRQQKRVEEPGQALRHREGGDCVRTRR